MDVHLKEAKKLHKIALDEFKRAQEKKDGVILRDACAKGWLAVLEALNALLIKRGIKEEGLPKTDRGRRYMVYKYTDKELELYYFSLRDALHTEGYYEGTLDPEEVKRHLEHLNAYIKKIEEYTIL